MSKKEIKLVANTLVIALGIYIAIFFAMAYIIMVAYNNSLPDMNDNYKTMSYSTALWFTLLLSGIGVYIKSNCGSKYKHHFVE